VTVAETRAHSSAARSRTLLYTTQLAAISQDPWFSRCPSRSSPTARRSTSTHPRAVSFQTAFGRRRWIRDELDKLGGAGVAKTSGADGLHNLHSAAAGDAVRAGLLYCQIVGDRRRQKHPKQATTDAASAARGQARLHRLLAEHPRQDARLRLQRAGQRLRRRVHAVDLERSGGRGRSTRLHDSRRSRREWTRSGICGRRCGKGKPVNLERITTIGDRSKR
jgi:hypothetical protein